VRIKDLCCFVQMVYDTKGLPGINTVGSAVDGVLQVFDPCPN
jgi:hypothetical protein